MHPTHEQWDRVERLFHDALAQPAERRAEFVLSGAGDDPLLGREVLSLLAALSHYDIDDAPVSILADALLKDAEPMSDGKRFGHYEVIQFVGGGAAADVYKARDVRLERVVALKIFCPGAAAPSALSEEARIACAAVHPNAVTIYDIGEIEGFGYIAMEFVDGETVADRLRTSGAFHPEEALQLAIQLGEALAALHAQGVVHRDVSARNVMITPSGRVKLLDFGIAHRSTGANGPQAGPQAGTVAYMSPERLAGAAADARSDLFSLGVLLHQILTGSHPFAGASHEETTSRILAGEPKRLTGITGLAPDFARAVARCLARNPDERFQDADSLVALLRQSQSRHKPIPQRAKVAVALALAALVLVLFLSGRLYLFDRTPEPGVKAPIRSLAVLPLADLSEQQNQSAFADSMTDALISELAAIDGLSVTAHSSVMRFRGARARPRDIARRLNVQGLIEGATVRAGDRVRITARLLHGETEELLWSRSWERPWTDVLAVQSELTKAVVYELRLKVASDPSRKPRAPSAAAYDSFLRGRHHLNRRTKQDIEKALTYFQTIVTDQPEYAEAWVGLAQAHNLLVPYAIRPPRVYQDSEAAAARAISLNPSLGPAYAVRGAVLHEYRWDHDAAEEDYRRAIQLAPNYAPAHHYYAEFLTRMRRYEEALAAILKARELDPLSLIINSIHGWILTNAGRPDEAIVQLRRTLDLDPRFAPAFGYLGAALMRKGLFQQAEDAYRSAQSLSGGNPRYAASLGVLYAARGEKAKASEILADLRRRRNGQAVPAFHFARVHAALGEREAAIEWLRRGCGEKTIWMLQVNNEPAFESLHGDSRFQAVLAEAGFRSAPRKM